MKIAIIVAMHEELQPFYHYFPKTELIFKKGHTTIEQVIDSTIYLVKSGIGPINASYTATWLCEKIAVDLIINSGSTGTFKKNFAIGDVIISSHFKQLNESPTFHATPLTDASQLIQAARPLFQTKNFTIRYGLIATTDKFIQTTEHYSDDIVAVDMESLAIAQIASLYHIPVLNIRGISDFADSKASELFVQNVSLASTNASYLVKQLVDILQ